LREQEKIETKEMENEKLGLHLKYCIVIFLIISSTIGGLALYNQKLAIVGLSNAGLLLSIVLAVIAILITLWDVAGQRNSIGKVEKSVDDLKNVSEGLEELVINALEAIESRQGELSVVTEILLEKADSIDAKGNADIKEQLNTIQKGLNRSNHMSEKDIKEKVLRMNSVNNNSEEVMKYTGAMLKYLDRKDK